MSGKVLCGATLRGSETGRLDPGHKCHYRAVAGTEPPRCRLHGGISERHLRAIATTLPAPTVRILHDCEGDWCVFELNGKAWCQGDTAHAPALARLFEAVGTIVERKWVQFDRAGNYEIIGDIKDID